MIITGITVYELLGLIKDGQAPKKVKYRNEVLYYDEESKDYYNDEDMHPLFAGANTKLDKEVEIIEEDVEITKWGDFAIDEVENKQLKMDNIKKYIAIIMRTQNEIIDEIKKLKGK